MKKYNKLKLLRFSNLFGVKKQKTRILLFGFCGTSSTTIAQIYKKLRSLFLLTLSINSIKALNFKHFLFWISLFQFELILFLPYKYRTTFVNLYCLKK